MKYKTKAGVEIEAVMFNGDNFIECEPLLKDRVPRYKYHQSPYERPHIQIAFAATIVAGEYITVINNKVLFLEADTFHILFERIKDA